MTGPLEPNVQVVPDIQGDTERDVLRVLLAEHEEQQNRLSKLEEYYRGEQPYAFLPQDVEEQLNRSLDQINTNIPRRVVNSITERLRITGIKAGDEKDPTLWELWREQDMPEKSAVLHREVFTYGSGHVVVWAAPDGMPQITIESARQLTALLDPASREVLAAVKRWREENPVRPENEVDHVVLYLPDQIIWYTANPGTAADSAAWQRTQTVDNPLGVVPVVPFYNADLVDDAEQHGFSEMGDVIPLTDGMNKLLLDLMVASEGYARPRRWATGIELEEKEVLDENGTPTGEKETLSPFDAKTPESVPWTAENSDARFGNFSASNLQAYEIGSRVLLGQVMLNSTLPAHYVGILTDNPTSAESIKGAEISLTATCHNKIKILSRPWEHVVKLIYAVWGQAIPAVVDIQWGDPATRTMTQEIDGVVKLFQAGVISQETAEQRIADLWGMKIEPPEQEVCSCQKQETTDEAGSTPDQASSKEDQPEVAA